MKYNNIINVLLTRFPELSNKYEEEKDYIEDLPHLVYEIIFVPYLIELSADSQKEKLYNALTLIEEMIVCTDEQVQNLAVVSVLEPLQCERKTLDTIRSLFGEKTKAWLNRLERFYGYIK